MLQFCFNPPHLGLASPNMNQPTPRRALVVGASAVLIAAGASACQPVAQPLPIRVPAPAPPAVPEVAPWTIMGPPSLSAEQLTAWYFSKPRPGARPAASVAELANLYIEEGNREGVAGDRAFIQAILETGWFRFSERVPPTFHNYAGIGAVDGGTTAEQFPNARTGVRAQIQHLKGYATPGIRSSDFASAIAAGRTQLVLNYIAGRATTWSQMGKGNWATDPDYATKLDSLYRSAAGHAGVAIK